jgi:MerR family transcriptional regulator, copper efflux regulator
VRVYREPVPSATYRIKEIADRSGFSPPTLRYYEEIGLLPTAARTPSGYRTYDDTTLARLAFIARAKQLGCTLDEINDLTTAWEGGRCGPIQDRLRVLVSEKLTAASDQIVTLMALSADLQRAATALELHRPEGACDDLCGCISEVQSDTTSFPVTLTAKSPSPAGEPPIACSLGSDSLRGRLDEWQDLLRHAVHRRDINDGVRVELDGAVPAGELMRLVAAEQECCQFLRFAITVDTRGIALEVRAPADARPIVESLFGAAA